MHRALKIIAAVVVLLVSFVLVGLLVFTNTNYGRERVRRLAENAIQDAANHGVVRLGRVSGNLLSGFTIANVSIRDSAGRPFVVVDTVSMNYGLRALILQRLELEDLRLVNPLIVLDRPPGDSSTWNYKYIFQSDRAPTEPKSEGGFGSWIVFRDITVVDGRLVLRSPWEPDDDDTPAQQDSSIADALAGRTRVVVERRDDGFQKIIEFRDFSGEIPYLRLKHPDYRARRVDIARLEMEALPFRPPAAVVRNLVGALEFTGDSIWFDGVRATMSASEVAAQGRFIYDTEEFDLVLGAKPLSLADIRWLFPQAPARGQGETEFRLRWRADTNTYVAQNTSVAIDDARLNGEFGVSLVGDSLWFHDTNLRFAAVDTRLIEQFAPEVEIPRHGTLSGRTTVDGPPGGMTIDADVAFDDARYGRSRVLADGEVGTTGSGVRFRDFDLRLDPVQVGLARVFAPDLPIGGTVRGTARLNGSTDAQLLARADLTHLDDGLRSRVAGTGVVRLGAQPWVDVDARLMPLSLAEVGRFAPALGLRGSAAGPVRVTGPLGAMVVDARLALPDGGRFDARGTLDLASSEKGYDLDTRMRLFNANYVVASAPRTSLTATAFARGRGFDPASMRAAIGADLMASTIDTVAIDSAHVRVGIANGLATVDSARVSGPKVEVELAGNFGLAAERTGDLTYRVTVDSLSAINRYLPAADTGVVPPRPRAYARRLARARADSLAVARATEIERLATGAAGPRIGPMPPPPTPIRLDSIAGSVRAAGVMRGNIRDFTVRGRAGAEGVVFRGNVLRRAQLEYAWVGAPGAQSTIAIGASLDSVSAAGFMLDSVEVRGSYKASAGDVALAIYQQSGEEYTVGGEFALHTDHNEVHIRDLALRFDTTRWVAAQPSAIRWGRQGIVIDRFELRNREDGRVFVNGNVPSEGAGGGLDLVIHNFQVADVAALVQSDIDFNGYISTTARLEGTTNDPRIRGAFGVSQASYGGTKVPDLRTSIEYASSSLRLQAEAADLGRVVAEAEGTIPINLAMNATGPRMLDAPIAIDVNSDGLPLDLASRFTDAIADVGGRLIGVVQVRGSARDPQIVGALAIVNGQVRLVPTGMRLTNVVASVRMFGDTVVIDSIAGRAGGRVLARGGLGIRELGQPSFDLYLVAQNARVLDNELGTIRADAGIAVRGPFDNVYVSGRAGIREGVINVPESDNKEVISARDPTLFRVIDTATVADEDEVIETQSPLMANLRMDVALDVGRDTWVRTSDANVEIYTPPERSLTIHVDRRKQAMVLAGEVSTDRGEYEFLSKRFQIRRGTATFIGTADLDPTLQITGEYEVRAAASQAVNIVIQIGGTLSNPRLSLASDAQPPLSQSDLLAYLAFGRSSSSLLEFGGSGLSGGGSTNLAGAGAQLVTQRLAAVALGVFVDEFEGQAARELGAAYVNVTPADLYAEVARGGEVSSFFKGTEVEVGKYTDPNTFIAVQTRLSAFSSNPDDRAVPGVRVLRRFGRGFRLDLSFEPRYIPQPSTLESVTPASKGVFGAFMGREWKF